MKFICNECNKEFGRKYDLSVHIRRIHTDKINQEKFECIICHRHFSTKYNMLNHRRKQHTIASDNGPYFFKCDDCPYKSPYKKNFQNHILKYHSTGSPSPVYKKFKQNCLSCDQRFHNRKFLLEHYKESHDIALQFEKLSFASFAEFKKWKSSCYYVEQKWKTVSETVVKFRCHRSGYYKDCCQVANKKRKRHLRISGTKRLNGVCPAEIVMRLQRDGSCIVTHQKVHFGHDINNIQELRHVRLHVSEKEEIARQLLEGVPEDTVIEKIYQARDENTDTDLRYNLINKNDVYNIAVSYQVNEAFTLDNDSVLVDAFILQHKESVLFYKGQGEKDTIFNIFGDDDIILIYQDAFQKECFLKYGLKFISFDATHGLNPYDLLLHTMLIIDSDDEGIPVAYLISNRSDQLVIDVFVRYIRDNVGTVVTQTIMSDMDPVYHKSYCSIMGPAKFTLFCTWHVRKAWNKNLNELITVTGQSHKQKRNSSNLVTESVNTGTVNIITRTERQRLIADTKRKLFELANELDEISFREKLTLFLSINHPNVKPFIEYFKKEYADKTEFWALCYRRYAGANTNIHMKSYHRVLKYMIGKGKKIQTLRDGLGCIEHYNEYRKNKNHKKFLWPTVPNKLAKLRKRHLEAEKFLEKQPFNIEVEECGQSWQVGSFSATADGIIEMYSVQKIETKECSLYVEPCQLRCIYCESCFHEYICSCYDAAISNNMCKHIHIVGLFQQKQATAQQDSIIPLDSAPLPVVSIEKSKTTPSNNYENEERSQDGQIQDVKLAEEVIKAEMHKLFRQFGPNMKNFDLFVKKYIRPLSSIFHAMQVTDLNG